MKKLLVLALVLVLSLSLLAGCGEKTPTPTEGTTLPATETVVTEAPETRVPAAAKPETIETENVAPTEALEGCSLYVAPVEGLAEDFILGMDASQVPALEQSGVKYYDFEGSETDVFKVLAQNGVNYIRVRVWNDPFDAQGNGYGGGNCTVDTALEIGRRATRYGMKLLVDFHYSDFWADPGKQMAPKAWKDLDLEAKAKALENYTYDSLMTLRNAGVDVGMVQVGNETNGALCGEKEWSAIVQLMNAGSRAVRAVYPKAKVAVHFANPESGAYPAYATNLKIYELDYDVFGSSYYPYWHGTLENLSSVLKQVKASTGKDVMVMETSYAWTTEDSDFSGNTISEDSAVDKPYPYSLQGQVNSLRSVTQAVQDAGGIGVCYWEGTWISVGTKSQTENQKLWEEYGSGWASSYAAEYDPEDAGKWYGGCAVDNQAFFDAQGRPLESLMAFNLMRYGNDVELKVQELEPIAARITVGDDYKLPGTVNAIMTDNSRVELPVKWSLAKESLADWIKTPGNYRINGEAQGMAAVLRLTVEGVNLLPNPSFEDGVDAPWIVENLGGCKELQLEQKAGDSRTGEWHYHFWDPDGGKVEFSLEQKPENLETGTYSFTIHVMGGDCGEAEVYAYAQIDGEPVGTAPMEITAWNEWHAGTVSGIEYQAGQELVLGIYVKTDAAGAWGKIDDASLSLE